MLVENDQSSNADLSGSEKENLSECLVSGGEEEEESSGNEDDSEEDEDAGQCVEYDDDTENDTNTDNNSIYRLPTPRSTIPSAPQSQWYVRIQEQRLTKMSCKDETLTDLSRLFYEVLY